MGGNALRQHESSRLTRAEYSALALFIEDKAAAIDLDMTYQIVRAYRDKVDYGDMDILFLRSNLTTLQQFIAALSPVEVVPKHDKDNVTSIGLQYPDGRVFQVDFIYTDNMDWGSVYFDYNDLGALMGGSSVLVGIQIWSR